MTFAASRIQGPDMPSRANSAAPKVEGLRYRDSAGAGGEHTGNNAGTAGSGTGNGRSAGVWIP